jgi:hypothetical protein
MNLRRVFLTTAAIALTATATCAATAGIKDPKGWSSPWGIGRGPSLHSNQDGWRGPRNLPPVTPLDGVSFQDRAADWTGGLFEVAVEIALKKASSMSPIGGLTFNPLTIVRHAPAMTPGSSDGAFDASPVPAPSALTVLGIAGLAARRRRRR